MPIPEPTLYPPFNIVRLSRVEYGVTDLVAGRAFYVGIPGLQVKEETDETLFLRAMAERGHHCRILRKAETASARYLSYRVYAEEDLDKAVAFYGRMGFRVMDHTEDDASKRLGAAWMHRKGGVHDVDFTNGTGPRLHHAAFWVPTPLNIIALLDLMLTTGYLANVERGPGRHGIWNAFFL